MRGRGQPASLSSSGKNFLSLGSWGTGRRHRSPAAVATVHPPPPRLSTCPRHQPPGAMAARCSQPPPPLAAPSRRRRSPRSELSLPACVAPPLDLAGLHPAAAPHGQSHPATCVLCTDRTLLAPPRRAAIHRPWLIRPITTPWDTDLAAWHSMLLLPYFSRFCPHGGALPRVVIVVLLPSQWDSLPGYAGSPVYSLLRAAWASYSSVW
jgi:hypothetical protein